MQHYCHIAGSGRHTLNSNNANVPSEYKSNLISYGGQRKHLTKAEIVMVVKIIIFKDYLEE